MSAGTPERPLRVAVVGSGPSGFYAAGFLLGAKEHTIEVDMFDRLPTPFGLVRGGVAPDHQKIKNVVRAYNKTAEHPGFRFFGNVRIGTDISVEQLRAHYDKVVFAHGCEGSRDLRIPGEELKGSHSATEFVGWYNAHPDYIAEAFELDSEAVVVVGVGNVAMDVARILAQDPEELAKTDIADHALYALRRKKVTDVYVLGRRGPAQVAFTPVEIEEIGSMEHVDLVLPDRSHELDELSALDFEHADKHTRHNVEYLQKKAAEGTAGKPIRVHLLLYTSPIEVLGENGRMTGVRCQINELCRREDGTLCPRPTDQTFVIDAGMMLRSVGYKGKPIEGLPFDDWYGILPNVEGRVVAADGTPMKGVYVVGWAKRGPSGLIGTNRADAHATVNGMLEDLQGVDASRPHTAAAAAAMVAEHCPEHTTWADWEALDELERSAGEMAGRVRVKIPTIEAMLQMLGR